MRYFLNRFVDFVPGAKIVINKEQWKEYVTELSGKVLIKMPAKRELCDGGLYVGMVGAGYMLYHIAKSTHFINQKADLLARAEKYVDIAMTYYKGKKKEEPAFLLGGAGVIVLGILAASEMNNRGRVSEFSIQYRDIGHQFSQKGDIFGFGSDEYLVGRSGYLSGALAISKVASHAIDWKVINAVLDAMVECGRKYSRKHKSPCPLMYAYYKTEYLGAAHGLSSIIQLILSFPDYLKSKTGLEQEVRACVDFMLKLQEKHNGNIPAAMDEANHPRPKEQELVHWCHGAPGVVYMFAKAYLVFNDDRYLKACLRCGELVWEKGLLRKGPGLCHGVAGNGYVFLLLYRLTNDPKHLYRALKFAEFLEDPVFKREASTPDSPFSLYEGTAGTTCFIVDLLEPANAAFPFLNVF